MRGMHTHFLYILKSSIGSVGEDEEEISANVLNANTGTAV